MTNRKPTLLKLALAVCLSALLLGCGSKINQENYAKIQNDMTMKEVKAILGEPTQSQTLGAEPLSYTSAIWKDSNGTTININFLNNKVQLKTFTKNK
jgi:outer membrane protein assembly factor BamE (lipoprotein component of BamABCDE complex)